MKEAEGSDGVDENDEGMDSGLGCLPPAGGTGPADDDPVALRMGLGGRGVDMEEEEEEGTLVLAFEVWLLDNFLLDAAVLGVPLILLD
jgi:hypothetical protein